MAEKTKNPESRVMRVTVSSINLPKKFNVRGPIDTEETEFKKLRQSIKEIGLLEPLVLRENPAGSGKFDLVSGWRRYHAIGPAPVGLGWDTVDVSIMSAATDDLGALYANLIENLQRQDLTAWAFAERCLMLRNDYKQTGEQIAANVGKSKAHVNSLIRCREKLHPKIVEAWRAADMGTGFERGGAEGQSGPGFTLQDLFKQSAKDPEEQKEWFESLTRTGGEKGGEGEDGKPRNEQSIRKPLTRARAMDLLAVLAPKDGKGFMFDAGNGKEWQEGAVMTLRWAIGEADAGEYTLRRNPFAAAIKAAEEAAERAEKEAEKEAKKIAAQKEKAAAE